MKKNNFILLVSGAFLICNISYSQTIRVGNINNGVTASGNTLSINNGLNSVQIAGMPPLVQGAITATKEVAGNNETNVNTANSSTANDANKLNAEALAKVEAAKNNFMKQQEDLLAKTNLMTKATEEKSDKSEDKVVRVGQDLSTLKPMIVTNDIGVYNKTTINEFEAKAKEQDTKTYRKFPEYVGKDY